jgi:hypothetical protein
LTWDLADKVAAVFTLIGFPLGIIGLYLTFREAQRSAERSQEAKTASEAAQDAVRNFRKDLNLFTSLADLAKALSMTDEIKRDIRDRDFNRLPDRLSGMRQLLIAIRGSNLGLSEKQNASFQSAIVNFRTLEVRFADDNNLPQNITELTESICNDVDSLHEILTELKSKIGAH